MVTAATYLVDELITEPGIYQMSADRYHADPVHGGSLSSHGARDLLACPAVFNHKRDNWAPIRGKTELDDGTAAHLAVLGAGASVVVVDAEDWRTKSAQQARSDAYTAGRTPILAGKWQEIRDTRVAAVRAHPLANALLTGGQPEQVLIWCDDATAVRCRAMVDYLHPRWIADYKTCESADPDAIQRAIGNYGYHIQAVHYQDGAAALGLGALPFYFVFQEKTPPFVVTVAELDDGWRSAGRRCIDLARQMYRDCTESGVWPAYTAPDEIVTIAAPRWLNTQEY